MGLKSVLKLAWRDLRASYGHSLAVFLIVVLATGTNFGMRRTAGAFGQALWDQAQAELAADLAVNRIESPTPEQWRSLEQLESSGVRWTLVTLATFAARSSHVPDPVALVVKGADPRLYPLRGEVRLDPPQSLARALAGNSAVVSSELLKQLGAEVGDNLQINATTVRISGRIESEPDRFFNGSYSSSLRAIVSRETLEQLQILRSGTPPRQVVLVRTPSGSGLAAAQTQLQRIFPEGLVVGVNEVNPQGSAAVAATASSLSAIHWVAFAVGIAGLAMAVRCHVESRIDTMALLKALGSRPLFLRLWLATELLVIGAAGGLAGSLAGFAAQTVLLRVTQLPPQFSVPEAAAMILEGVAGAGMVCGLLGMSYAISLSRWRPVPMWTRQVQNTLAFERAPGVSGTLARYLRPAVKHGVNNVLWAGSAALVPLVAFVVMLTTAVATGQSLVVRSILKSLPVSDANLYLTGFAHSQIDGVRRVLDRQVGIERRGVFMNLAWMRVGGASALTDVATAPLRLVSCSPELAPDSGAIVDVGVARRMGIGPGSKLYFEAEGVVRQTFAAAVRDVPPVQRNWYSITVPCSLVDSQTLFHGALLSVPENRIAALRHELQARYPFLGIVPPTDFFAELNRLLSLCTRLVRFLALSTLAGGAVLIVAVIAAMSRRRAKLLAVFRALGAQRAFLAGTLTTEFAVVGALSGLAGGVAGVALMDLSLSYALETRLLDPQIPGLVLGIAAGAVLCAASGWLACARLLRERPLSVLRTD